MKTSLRDIAAQKQEAQAQSPTVQAAQVAQAASFSQEELTAQWDEFANRLEKKVYLKNTMLNCKPVLADDFTFEVAVHNPGQQDELANAAIDILSFLRAQLHNGKIQMRVRILVTNEKHLAYTASEKYEYLMSINPNLQKLKDAFDLRLD